MQVLSLTLGEKTYTTVRVTAFMSKEAMRINRDAMALAKRSKEIKEELDADAAEEILDELLDLNDRKVNLICEVYGNKFTADEVLNGLTAAEIDAEVQKITRGVTGVIVKN
jgi:hypothetical protein